MVYLLPAGLLVGIVLVVPLAWAVVDSLHGGLRNYADVLRDGQVRHAVYNSLFWLVLAPVVCVFGLLLAWTIGAHRRIGVLAAPIAVSALVTGLAFRLIAQPGDFLLGPTGIWLVLGLAFAWQWAGLAVVVFRSGLNAIPPGLVRMAKAFGVSRAWRLRTVIGPALLPAGALVLIIALVAAARVFDLILIAAPGSDQAAVDVIGLHWWRFRDDLRSGESAALTVMQFAIAAIAALVGLWGLSREWPTRSEPPAPPRKRRRGRVVVVLAVALWVLPLFVLLMTSLHTPRAAAAGGWWSGGFGLDSYRRAFQSGELAGALVNTGARSVFAAVLLLVVAVPAAYALAWGGLPRRVNRALIAVTTVVAVVPPQTVIVELGQVFDRMHLLGAPTALTVVHTAFGVPLAVLLLRASFASVPREVVHARRYDAEPGSPLFAVVRESLPALVTVAVLEFVLVWNDYVVGLLLGGPESGQVTFVLSDQARQFVTSESVMAAGAVVATVIPLGLVVATGNWLVRGFTSGVGREPARTEVRRSTREAE
ncbi:MAG: Alpha-glucoside transport system permease protein [Actinoallomurus sp.]|nr:Alpha-glucoside transport system permease protein [Actinoallomurus sp.]